MKLLCEKKRESYKVIDEDLNLEENNMEMVFYKFRMFYKNFNRNNKGVIKIRINYFLNLKSCFLSVENLVIFIKSVLFGKMNLKIILELRIILRMVSFYSEEIFVI